MLAQFYQQSLMQSERSLKSLFMLAYPLTIIICMIFSNSASAMRLESGIEMELIREYVYPLEKDIQLELVYRSNLLSDVRLTNEGEPVILSIFQQHYTLGHNETLSIKSPPVKHFVIRIQPYALGFVSSTLLATPKERVFYVRLHNAFFRVKDTV